MPFKRCSNVEMQLALVLPFHDPLAGQTMWETGLHASSKLVTVSHGSPLLPQECHMRITRDDYGFLQARMEGNFPNMRKSHPKITLGWLTIAYPSLFWPHHKLPAEGSKDRKRDGSY